MRIISFCIIALLGLPGAASAKCAFAKYQVEGNIKTPEGVDPSTLRLYLFLEGMTHVTDYPPTSNGAEHATADASGHFIVKAWMNTFSGRSLLTGDKCRRVADFGDLVIVGPGIRARRIKVDFHQPKKQVLRQLGASVKVPEIELEILRGKLPPESEEQEPRHDADAGGWEIYDNLHRWYAQPTGRYPEACLSSFTQ